MNKHSVTIEVVENGFKVTDAWEIEGENSGTKRVIEDEDNPKRALKDLFILLDEYIGDGYRKYEKDNLRVSWDLKGHKID